MAHVASTAMQEEAYWKRQRSCADAEIRVRLTHGEYKENELACFVYVLESLKSQNPL